MQLGTKYGGGNARVNTSEGQLRGLKAGLTNKCRGPLDVVTCKACVLCNGELCKTKYRNPNERDAKAGQVRIGHQPFAVLLFLHLPVGSWDGVQVGPPTWAASGLSSRPATACDVPRQLALPQFCGSGPGTSRPTPEHVVGSRRIVVGPGRNAVFVRVLVTNGCPGFRLRRIRDPRSLSNVGRS